MPAFPRRRRPLAAMLALAVVSVFVVVAYVEAAQSRADLDGWMTEQAELVEEVVQEVINGVFGDLEALAAFVEQADPDSASFETFADRISGTANSVGVAYVTRVAADDTESYLDERRRLHGNDYAVFGLTPDGDRQPLVRTGRTEFYPVEYFSLGDLIEPFLKDESTAITLGRGLDAGFDPIWREDIQRALQANEPALSEFIEIGISSLALDRVFIVSVPVRDEEGAAQGLVIAMMMEQLLLNDLDNRVLEDVEWEVIPSGESPTRIPKADARIHSLEMPGTTWSLAIAPTEEASARLEGTTWWAAGATAGALALLFAVALWLFIDRRSEHRRAARFRQLSDDKDRFLASVSHELRTPLTVVSGLASELHDRPDSFTVAEQSNLLAMMVEQANELSAIVEDLLVAARHDIGKVVIHSEPIDLELEVERAIQASGIPATTVGTTVPALGDAQRVGQILRNLLTNAKRYGGPDVRVEFSSDSRGTEVVVADNGPGVPVEKAETIFESYQSAHTPDSTVKSVGLGLYISRTLARAMRGDLDYAHDGTWSRFRLRLPAMDLQDQTPHTASPSDTMSPETANVG